MARRTAYWTLGLAAAAAGLASVPAQAAQCGGRPCIHIGAMNIKLLGTSGPADSAAEYREIGRLLSTTMDLDVVVLEEINVRSTQWRDLKAELEGRGYSLAFESAFGGEREQYIAVAYRRSSVELTAPPPSDLPFATSYRETGSDCFYENIRPPVTAAFRASQFDFRVIGVHLKSQLPVGKDTQCDDRIRTEQAKRIVAFTQSTAADERDTIILGDFNSSFPSAENEPFRAAGMRSAMEDRASGSGEISFVGRPRGLIDQIVFRRDDKSYAPGSGFVFKLADADRRFYLDSISDHVPIRASFFTDRDDD